MSKNKTSLFDKEDINLYDTVTLNTENLMDAVEEAENSIDNIDLTLEDFEQYKEETFKEDLTKSSARKKFDEFDDISKSKQYVPLEKEEGGFNNTGIFNNTTEINMNEILNKELPQENIKEFNIQSSFNVEDVRNTSKINASNIIDTEKFQKDVIEKSSFGKVRIMAVGVGGCGCNAINRMQTEGIENIQLVAIDTSAQTLDNTKADKKILVGEKFLLGHGSGNDVDKAKEAFELSKEEIKSVLHGVDMVFITGGIGRGTGSAGLVEIGKYAREMGILTIGFATLPKVMEADMRIVEQYYELFTEAVDSNVIVENDKVTKVAYNLPINQAMKLADQMLIDGIKGISDLIINPGKINLDYADIKTAFANQGSCIMGIGYATGEDLVIKAIDNSINSELVDVESMKTANTIIFNISCAKNTITIKEASDGTDLIYSRNASKDIQHMLFGYSYDETLEGKVKVTFIATGTGTINFDNYKNKNTFKSTLGNDLNKTGNFGSDIFTNVGTSSGAPDFFN